MNVSLLDGGDDEDFEKSIDFDARHKTSAPSYSLLFARYSAFAVSMFIMYDRC